MDGHARVIGLGSKSIVCHRDAWRAGNSARTDLRTRPVVVGEHLTDVTTSDEHTVKPWFKHDQHVINLSVWPVADLKDSGPTSTTREGFNLLHWTCSGMSFWAVSDVNPAALRRFEADYDRQTNGSSQS